MSAGVRYGYSALAFLSASPTSEYTGIDLDCAEFGGTPGAVDWARRQAKNYKANFLVANTQLMHAFPGGMYDLIHVDDMIAGRFPLAEAPQAFARAAERGVLKVLLYP